ncbi:hypothetical protein BJ742DRAFT_842149 [Cladochytrium replicatum]|nr:hypothetical protein BJ742DRAFT_842149 [Cladochytrium replicatum]
MVNLGIPVLDQAALVNYFGLHIFAVVGLCLLAELGYTAPQKQYFSLSISHFEVPWLGQMPFWNAGLPKRIELPRRKRLRARQRLTQDRNVLLKRGNRRDQHYCNDPEHGNRGDLNKARYSESVYFFEHRSIGARSLLSFSMRDRKNSGGSGSRTRFVAVKASSIFHQLFSLIMRMTETRACVSWDV